MAVLDATEFKYDPLRKPVAHDLMSLIQNAVLQTQQTHVKQLLPDEIRLTTEQIEMLKKIKDHTSTFEVIHHPASGEEQYMLHTPFNVMDVLVNGQILYKPTSGILG